jgi:hypothetical protein
MLDDFVNMVNKDHDRSCSHVYACLLSDQQFGGYKSL